ncbi:MAG: sulfotransferase family protein [Kordiimonadaceae bacterium]|nr:sulfotransferase family protein [Kordiimonadaceae bacterium]
MKPILFVHIPKTAGTSLHNGALDILGSSAVERDNGNTESATTQMVKDHLYRDIDLKDPFKFYEAFKGAGKKWLTAHIYADRLLRLFGVENTVSFVRDPIERVISDYRFTKKIGKTDLSFEEFYRHPSETNKQYRMVGTVPWQAFHLVGSLTRYSECIDFLSSSKLSGLSEKHTNINTPPKPNEISEDVQEDIKRWNERDCIFYAQATAYLDQHLTIIKSGKPFCYHDSGFSLDEHIIGWAFYAGSNEVVRIGLYVDGHLKNEIGALEHRPDLHILQTPRGGHNGYRFVLSEYTHASHIEVRALNTEQTLFSWTRP